MVTHLCASQVGRRKTCEGPQSKNEGPMTESNQAVGQDSGAHAGTRAARIEAILRAALAPVAIDVEDESAAHAHHAGMRGATSHGETHFDVLVTSAAFDGLSRIARHRLVHDLLKDEFATGLHALSLHLETPK